MNTEQLTHLFANINMWKRGSERAPHKPLLLLYALGKCQRGEPRAIRYAEIDPVLRQFLRDFGPTRKVYHTDPPFWRLRHDGIWEVQGADDLLRQYGNTNVRKSALLERDARGGFPEPIYALLRAHPRLLIELAHDLLEGNFPHSLHDDILAATGLDLGIETIMRPNRDPQFRARVLTVYEYRCAICGFDVRLGDTALGVEAAHIKWHQAGGPDVETNGIALCILHHKLFDRGAFTLGVGDHRIQVSEYAHGSRGFQDWLLAFHGKAIRPPQSGQYAPHDEYLHWHLQQVFRGPARQL